MDRPISVHKASPCTTVTVTEGDGTVDYHNEVSIKFIATIQGFTIFYNIEQEACSIPVRIH